MTQGDDLGFSRELIANRTAQALPSVSHDGYSLVSERLNALRKTGLKA